MHKWCNYDHTPIGRPEGYIKPMSLAVRHGKLLVVEVPTQAPASSSEAAASGAVAAAVVARCLFGDLVE